MFACLVERALIFLGFFRLHSTTPQATHCWRECRLPLNAQHLKSWILALVGSRTQELRYYRSSCNHWNIFSAFWLIMLWHFGGSLLPFASSFFLTVPRLNSSWVGLCYLGSQKRHVGLNLRHIDFVLGSEWTFQRLSVSHPLVARSDPLGEELLEK